MLGLKQTVAGLTLASVATCSAYAGEKLDAPGGIRGEMSQAFQDENFRKELQALGIDPSEAKMRVAAMTDTELQEMKDGVQRQAGGDVIVISLTTILLVIIIILLLN